MPFFLETKRNFFLRGKNKKKFLCAVYKTARTVQDKTTDTASIRFVCKPLFPKGFAI
jgi:hypothetical protein